MSNSSVTYGCLVFLALVLGDLSTSVIVTICGPLAVFFLHLDSILKNGTNRRAKRRQTRGRQLLFALDNYLTQPTM